MDGICILYGERIAGALTRLNGGCKGTPSSGGDRGAEAQPYVSVIRRVRDGTELYRWRSFGAEGDDGVDGGGAAGGDEAGEQRGGGEDGGDGEEGGDVP